MLVLQKNGVQIENFLRKNYEQICYEFFMHSPSRITIIFLAISTIISCLVYFPKYREQQNKAQRLAELLSGPNGSVILSQQTKTSGCVEQDARPDPACTPGAVFAAASTPLEKICVQGYTKTVRNVPQKLRKSVFAEYGISLPVPRGAYEVDHFIPLAIGGSNDIANLFPQPAKPPPGFHEKDIVENYLHQEVCAGRVALSVAQRQISENWLDIYNNLTDEQIQRIKNEFKVQYD